MNTAELLASLLHKYRSPPTAVTLPIPRFPSSQPSPIPRNAPFVQVQPCQNRKNPQIPILRPPSSDTRICACKPSADGLVYTATDGRTRSPSGPSIVQHSGRKIPGCSSRPASHYSQGSARRLCPAPCPPHPQKPMALLLPLPPTARMPMARAERLVTRTRPCGCDSTFVRPEHSIWTAL